MPKSAKKAIGFTQPFITVPDLAFVSTRAPTTADTDYDLGQTWIYRVSSVDKRAYIYCGEGIWVLSSPGASDVDTLTGDGGGPISPAAGNITLAGGTNITSSGAASTITFNLDAAITLATSVTSPLYTAAAATDVAITAPAGQDVVIKLGDAAGANKVSILDSASVEVFSIDSNGGLPTIGGALTVTGLITGNGSALLKSAGTALNLGTDNSGDAVNVGTGTVARAISIGTGNAAHTVAIGTSGQAGAITVDTAAGISLDAATASNFTVTGAADLTLRSTAGSVIAQGGEAVVDAVRLYASDAAGGIDVDAGTGGIAVDTTGALSLDSAAASNFTVTGAFDLTLSSTGGSAIVQSAQAAVDAVRLYASDAAGGFDFDAGTGGITIDTTGALSLDSAAASNFTVTGAFDLTAQSTAGSIIVQAGEAAVDAVRLYASNAAGGFDFDAGTGGIAVDTTGAYSIDGAAASNVSVSGAGIDLTVQSSAGRVVVDGGEAAADSVRIVASDVAGGIDIDAGTGGIAAATTGAYTLDAAGVLELNSSAGAISIGNDAVSQAINVGTAGARTVTVGSTTGASALVLQSGTGDITVTGTVKQIDAELMGQTGIYVPAFTQGSIASLAANTAGAAAGATGTVNAILLQGGYIMEGFVLGAGQTILQPIMGANGLIISADQTNTEGMEYNFPYLKYTIGTSAAFAFELSMYINDMDGAGPYVFGFRKVEANNATFADYTDYATIGMIAASSTTKVVTATELNSAGQVVTVSSDNWGGDGTNNKLRVLVSAAGVVTYTLNGSALGGAAAFTFDNGDAVIPFIRITHTASPTTVAMTQMRIGFQA